MNAARIVNVADARRRAARRIPRVLFDYIDGAAEDEQTAARNSAAAAAVTFRPRAGAGVREPRLSTELFGTTLSFPLVLGPCGLVKFMHPDGAVGVARAAEERGIVSVLSTVAGNSPEEVTSATSGPKWFQLYAPAGREQAEQLVDRAQRAGFGALVVTMDTAALGKRERDAFHGVSMPFRLRPDTAVKLGLQVAARPGWVAGVAGMVLREKRAAGGAGSPVSPGPEGSAAGPPPNFATVAMDASPFTWDEIASFRKLWSGPLLVKGLVTAEDAKSALQAGVDGIVVSNHGGRQLEGAPATLTALPEVVEAVGGAVPVLVDGGIRRGGDIVKALALGATAVSIGRPYLYGLAAAGKEGVGRVIDVLRSEMRRTMVLLGCPDVADLDGSWINRP